MTTQKQKEIITREHFLNREEATGSRHPLVAILKETILSYNLRDYLGFTCFLFQANNRVSKCYLYFLFLPKLNLYLMLLVG